jgi:hypothetical protein
VFSRSLSRSQEKKIVSKSRKRGESPHMIPAVENMPFFEEVDKAPFIGPNHSGSDSRFYH